MTPASLLARRLHALRPGASLGLPLTTSLSRQYSGSGSAEQHFDLLVLGGGSGGLACAKEASLLGAKVALLDYVSPSPRGSKWGLGGTCVNVGCIPKKLMHHASLLGESFSDARGLGWSMLGEPRHAWGQLVQAVQNHIRSINFGYTVQLRSERVEYINAMGRLLDAHTVHAIGGNGERRKLTADTILIAVGGRPSYPGVTGDQELCITSDDIFSQAKPPGRTLVVGGSYIALETAGFLAGLGFDTTVMARSILLRGFDQQIAEMIGLTLEQQSGIRVIRNTVPQGFSPGKQGQAVACTWQPSTAQAPVSEEFDTVVLAVGRQPNTANLGLQAAGVEMNSKTGKIPVKADDSTNVPTIYAIGDVALGRPELTPPAIQAGVLLARRLFGGSTKLMDYSLAATTVFTPIEYSCVGLSEEDAAAKHGPDGVEVYHTYFKPLEWSTNHDMSDDGIPHRPDNACYAKVVTLRGEPERVIGLHYLGPNAGEVMQGFAAAMRCGLTKEALDDTVGIHPTTAEEFTNMFISKRSGLDPFKTGC